MAGATLEGLCERVPERECMGRLKAGAIFADHTVCNQNVHPRILLEHTWVCLF